MEIKKKCQKGTKSFSSGGEILRKKLYKHWNSEISRIFEVLVRCKMCGGNLMSIMTRRNKYLFDKKLTKFL